MAVGRFSTPFQPHEYTNPFDLGTYATLITERQRLYDTNLKAMSGQLAKYTNIPISRDVDKEYIGEKITGLNQNVNSLGAMDYSDPNVVSRISSMISGFAEDPRIKNALLSSNQMMKDEAEIEAAKKNKTYSQQNEWEVRLAQNDYMKSTDGNAVYQSPKYQAYTGDALLGVKGFAQDINAKGEASIVTADGKTIKIKKSELTAERINQLLPNLVTPEAFAQLRRDALWTHRGLSTDPTNPNFNSTKDFVVSQMSGKVRKQLLFTSSKVDMLINQIQSTSDPKLKEELTSQKDALSNQIATYKGQLNNPDYLFSEGSKKDVFQSLITDAYTNQRLGSLGLIYAVSEQDISAIGGSGTSKGKVEAEVTSNYTYNPAFTENVGLNTKNSLAREISILKQNLGDDKTPGTKMMSIISDMRTQNPNLYASYTQEEMIKAYRAKERLYAEGKLTGDENQMFRTHFSEISDMKVQYEAFNELEGVARKNLESKPEYKSASNGLRASEKLLKPEYTLNIQSDKGPITKTYKKADLIAYMNALEQMGSQPGRPWVPTSNIGKLAAGIDPGDIVENWINQPKMDVSKPIPLQDANNELINDVNKGMANMLKMRQADSKGLNMLGYGVTRLMDNLLNPIRVESTAGVLGGGTYEYDDPLQQLIDLDLGFSQHITTRREFAQTVNELEEKAYGDLGYMEMNPTFNVNLKPEIQQNNLSAVGNLVRQHGMDDDEKSRAVESWTGIRSVPGGQIEVDYTYKDEKTTKSATLRVPREVAGSLKSFIPEDNTRAFEATIRKIGATTTDPVKAPKMQWGNVIIPYRITYNRSQDAFQLQVFQNGQLIDKYTDNLKFKSLNDFYVNKESIARQVAELTNPK